MTECGIGQRGIKAIGRTGQRARAVPTLPLLSCGYWEEQRSAVTATAWRPLSLKAAEQAVSRPVSAFPGAYRAQGPEGLGIAAGHRAGGFAFQDCQSVRIYVSELCHRQDSNLRSRLRSPFPRIALTCRNVLAEILPGRISGAARRRSAA